MGWETVQIWAKEITNVTLISFRTEEHEYRIVYNLCNAKLWQLIYIDVTKKCVPGIVNSPLQLEVGSRNLSKHFLPSQYIFHFVPR